MLYRCTFCKRLNVFYKNIGFEVMCVLKQSGSYFKITCLLGLADLMVLLHAEVNDPRLFHFQTCAVRKSRVLYVVLQSTQFLPNMFVQCSFFSCYFHCISYIVIFLFFFYFSLNILTLGFKFVKTRVNIELNTLKIYRLHKNLNINL